MNQTLVVLGLVLIVLGVIADATGLLSPIWAMLAHELGSIVGGFLLIAGILQGSKGVGQKVRRYYT